MTVVTPIHVAAIGLGNMRFYAPPLSGQEFPWVALEDAMHCFGLPRGMRRRAKQDMQREWKGQAQTVATNDGVVTIVPHFMAQGMAYAMIDCGRCDGSVLAKYGLAGSAAMSKLTDGLGSQEIFDYLGAAIATEESKGRRS